MDSENGSKWFWDLLLFCWFFILVFCFCFLEGVGCFCFVFCFGVCLFLHWFLSLKLPGFLNKISICFCLCFKCSELSTAANIKWYSC